MTTQERLAEIRETIDMHYNVSHDDCVWLLTLVEKYSTALESLDQPLCEHIIDDCGFDPEHETQETLAAVVKENSESNERLLNIVRAALSEKGEK